MKKTINHTELIKYLYDEAETYLKEKNAEACMYVNTDDVKHKYNFDKFNCLEMFCRNLIQDIESDLEDRLL